MVDLTQIPASPFPVLITILRCLWV